MSWGLRRVVARRFTGPAALAADAAHTARLSTYLTDMLAPYGLGLRAGALDPVRGQSYGEMARPFLDGIEPVDLLVLASDVPDITPGRATATYLSHLCPGGPMAFGISDQGPAAAFTGLLLARSYGVPALLIALEQADLPYDPGVPVSLPAHHAAVALHLGPAAGAAVDDVTVLSDVDSDRAVDLIAGHNPTAVVLGRALAHLDVKADRLVHAAADQPMTGVWAALEPLVGAGTVVVADYDPALRYLCVAALSWQP